MSTYAEQPPQRRYGRRGGCVETDVPARLDRLPWSGWHWLIVVALGSVWILDGLEVTIVGAIAAVLTDPHTLGLSPSQVGLTGSIYVAGAVIGALAFGYLTDRFGRKRLFMITLGLYLIATTCTAFTQNFTEFALARFFTGAGIGGEYSAINSAIDELIPARLRGTIDIAINGSWWVGTAVGAVASIYLLDPTHFAVDTGWRIGFGIGATLAVGVLLIRRFVPESPRWLMTHGRAEDAEELVRRIERKVRRQTGEQLDRPDETIAVEQREAIGFGTIIRNVFGEYRRRSVLGFTLMMTQAFLYNAVFFTYALVLTTYYGVSESSIGWYLLPFAVGNFLGPLLLGRLFDVVGRKAMIAGTYIVSGVLLAVTAALFQQDAISATQQTALWSIIFFFASAGASSAYLTVSEVFPMETRAMAIAFFYACATGAGGIIGPAFYAHQIGAAGASGDRTPLFWGYILAAALMVLGGIVEIWLGVRAEQRGLEDVAEPITAGRGRVRGRLSRRRTRPGERARRASR